MEAMVSSSIEKFRVQSASTKEPNLLYKLMVSKVIAKLKAVLFDPAFVGHHDQKKNCKERRRRRRPLNQTESCDDPVVTVAEPVVKDRSPVQTQLQTLLRKRIAAKLGRVAAVGSGESRAKVRRLSSKDEMVRPPPRDTPDLTRKIGGGAGEGGAGGGGGLTLLIPFQCLSQTG